MISNIYLEESKGYVFQDDIIVSRFSQREMTNIQEGVIPLYGMRAYLLLDGRVWSGYAWSTLSEEYGSTGYGCQSCSSSTDQRIMHFPLPPFAPENLI